MIWPLPDFIPQSAPQHFQISYHPDHFSALRTPQALCHTSGPLHISILPSWKHPLNQRMLVNQPICSHSKYYYVTGNGFIYLILYFVSLASLEINKLLEEPYLFCSSQCPWYPIQCHTGRYSTQPSLNNSHSDRRQPELRPELGNVIGLVPDTHNKVKIAMKQVP